MGKDDIKPNDYCPDCVEGGAASDPDPNDADCCCCCCSCSENGSDSESNNVANGRNQAMVSLEQRKKDLLANLTILKTNREQVSVQHLLQFIEAFNHAPDFIRRYNLQEDFCLECLLSEPTCTCCITGISQMNLNDQSCDSCDECNRDENSHQQRYNSQGCSDCVAMRKIPNFERPITENSRERRRRRRRQRNIQHNLPRVSVTNFSSNGGRSTVHVTPQHPSNRGTGGLNNVSLPRVSQNELEHNNDRCNECHGEENIRRRNSPVVRRCSDFARISTNEDSDFCEECSGSNSLLRSCTIPGCNECDNENQPGDIHGRSSFNGDIGACTCCFDSSKDSCFDENLKDKQQFSSSKPECDQNETCGECSNNRQDQVLENCTCEECQENSDCSDESCSECQSHNSSEKKKKK